MADTQDRIQTSEARWSEFSDTHPRSAELSRRAAESLVGGFSHNLRLSRPFPLYFHHGEGPHKWDVDGIKYVDYAMGSASLLMGHRPQDLQQAVNADLTGIGAACHEREVEWGELVKSLIPSAESVRFLSSGTEATMLALRVARAFTGRKKILRLQGHYHGWHDYFMVGYRPPYDGLATAGVPSETTSNTLWARESPTDQIEALLATGDVAAVILEPSGATWGTVPLQEGLLSYLREATRRHGTLLIFDEVISGFRFSPGGAQALVDILPDLTTLGKIITGGLPGAALTGRSDVLDVIRPGKGPHETYALHYGTFNGHPIAAGLGVITLKQVADGNVQAAADEHAAALRAAIRDILTSLSIRGFVYGTSSTFHMYLESPTSDDRYEDVSDVPLEKLLAIPKDTVDAFACELRLRGVDLMSYTSGVTSSAHTAVEVELASEAFEGALRALRDSGLVATD